MFGRVSSTVTRLFPINRIDKACLAFGILVLLLYAVVWLLLLVVAGTGPVHLAEACLIWAAKTEMLLVLPTWLMARLGYSLYEILNHSRASYPP
jgi:hypothetical protein